MYYDYIYFDITQLFTKIVFIIFTDKNNIYNKLRRMF